MRYKNVGVKAGHKLFIRERSSAFDKSEMPSGSFQDFEDHKKMKTWEYAAFQKEQFKQIKQRRKRFYTIVIASIIGAIICLLLIGLFVEWFNEYGGPH